MVRMGIAGFLDGFEESGIEAKVAEGHEVRDYGACRGKCTELPFHAQVANPGKLNSGKGIPYLKKSKTECFASRAAPIAECFASLAAS